ncbi:hypothetical protein LCGC14_1800190, partial [marine sediment metagenome]
MKRFWAKVIKNKNGCWEWKNATDTSGYGLFWKNGKHHKAHRISWELHNGKIPKGLLVLHTCDNPLCVNPNHLWLGTNQDNQNDMYAKNRGKKATGEKHGCAKLTWEVVRIIRKLYKRPEITQTILEK